MYPLIFLLIGTICIKIRNAIDSVGHFQLEIQEIYKKAFLDCHLFFNLFVLRLFQSTVEYFLLTQVYIFNVVQNIDASFYLNLFLCSINDLNVKYNIKMWKKPMFEGKLGHYKEFVQIQRAWLRST